MSEAGGAGTKRALDDKIGTPEFIGKIAVVTGSTSGIGESVATTLSSKGFSVVITGSTRSAEYGEQLAGGLAHDAAYFSADITKDEECRALIDKVIAKYGRLDLLVRERGL